MIEIKLSSNKTRQKTVDFLYNFTKIIKSAFPNDKFDCEFSDDIEGLYTIETDNKNTQLLVAGVIEDNYQTFFQ